MLYQRKGSTIREGSGLHSVLREIADSFHAPDVISHFRSFSLMISRDRPIIMRDGAG